MEQDRLKVTQRVLPTGPFYDALRSGSFEVAVEFNCQNMVNPLLDVAKVLPRSVYHPRTTAVTRTPS